MPRIRKSSIGNGTRWRKPESWGDQMSSTNALGGYATEPAYDLAPITPGAGLLTDPDGGAVYVARALLCEVGGVATIVTAAGKTRTGVPLQAGMNPISAQRVTAVTDVTNLWGVKA
jgi:hypothetical protein